ncbi:MAG: sugar phosphate isomerase/epimerase [Clostridia bacterium]|nr:sugar phosphate isomerase/epimerase [Clostridia bacterium]
MLLSTQTSALVSRFGFEDGIVKLRDAGYDCLDLSLFEMSSDASVYNSDGWREITEARRAFADANGIVFDQSHAPFSFAWADASVRENVAGPRVQRALEISAIMGVKNVIVHPLHWFPYKGFEAEARRINIDYYRSFIPVCRDLGINVALENMWQKEVKRKCISLDVAARAEEFASMLDEIGDEHIVGCLDLGHVSLIGEEAEDAIRVLGHDRLKALHVHDNGYTADDHVLPGLGKMNWTAIMQALGDIDYTGVFTYEADGFLRNFENDFIPAACRFMVEKGRYLLAKLPK